MSTISVSLGAVDEPKWLTAREDRAWRGYRRMRTLLDLALGRDLTERTGLSEPDYDVLSTLSEAAGGRLRLRDLAAHLLWSPSRLSHHVTRMQARGLVRREDVADDGRGSEVVLTDEGWTAIRSAAPHHVASVREHLVDLLTDEEIDVLATLSRRVVDHLTASGAATSPPR